MEWKKEGAQGYGRRRGRCRLGDRFLTAPVVRLGGSGEAGATAVRVVAVRWSSEEGRAKDGSTMGDGDELDQWGGELRMEEEEPPWPATGGAMRAHGRRVRPDGKRKKEARPAVLCLAGSGAPVGALDGSKAMRCSDGRRGRADAAPGRSGYGWAVERDRGGGRRWHAWRAAMEDNRHGGTSIDGSSEAGAPARRLLAGMGEHNREEEEAE